MTERQAHFMAGGVGAKAKYSISRSFVSHPFPRSSYLAVALVLLPWLFIIFLPTIYVILMWFGLVAFSVVALRRLELGLYLFLALGPLQMLVRRANETDLILNAWYEFLFLILFASWLIRISRDKNLMSGLVISRFVFIIGFIFGFQALRSSSLSVGILGLRESFRFLFLFPVIVSIVSLRRENARGLLHSMFLGIAMLAVLQDYSYFSGWVPYPDRQIIDQGMVRTIAGYPFERMIGITFGGVSGFVETLAPFIWIAALLGFFEERKRWLWLIFAIGATALCILTVSYTLLVALALGNFAFLVIRWRLGIPHRKAISLLCVSFLILPLSILLVYGGIIGVDVGSGEALSLYDRIKDSLWVYTDRLPLEDPVAFMIGHGLRFRGGALLVPEGSSLFDEENLVDAGWAALAYMLGIPAAIWIAIWFGRILVKGITMYVLLENNGVGSQQERLTLFVTIIAYAASFASLHTVPWMLFGGPDSNFVALAALVASLAHNRRHEIPGRSQNSIYAKKCLVQKALSARVRTI